MHTILYGLKQTYKVLKMALKFLNEILEDIHKKSEEEEMLTKYFGKSLCLYSNFVKELQWDFLEKKSIVNDTMPVLIL